MSEKIALENRFIYPQQPYCNVMTSPPYELLIIKLIISYLLHFSFTVINNSWSKFENMVAKYIIPYWESTQKKPDLLFRLIFPCKGETHQCHQFGDSLDDLAILANKFGNRTLILRFKSFETLSPSKDEICQFLAYSIVTSPKTMSQNVRKKVVWG